MFNSLASPSVVMSEVVIIKRQEPLSPFFIVMWFGLWSKVRREDLVHERQRQGRRGTDTVLPRAGGSVPEIRGGRSSAAGPRLSARHGPTFRDCLLDMARHLEQLASELEGSTRFRWQCQRSRLRHRMPESVQPASQPGRLSFTTSGGVRRRLEDRPRGHDHYGHCAPGE